MRTGENRGKSLRAKWKEDPTTGQNEKKILRDEWKREPYGEDGMERKGNQKGYE